MAKVYSRVKGAQGVAPGVIVPFSRECQSTAEKDERVPGGYLRCDGKIYQARDYPSLARIIGVGPNGGNGIPGCRFNPGLLGSNLLNPTFDADGDFTSGTFCVPNLGAKVLIPSGTAGQEFTGNIAMSGSGTYERAGIGYRATIQPTVNSTFNGSVTGPAKTADISGNPQLTATGTSLSSASLSAANIARHSHGDFAWQETDVRPEGVDTDMQDNTDIHLTGVNVTNFSISHNGGTINHNHSVSGQNVAQHLEFTRQQVTISFAGSSCQGNVSADPRESLNHVTTPYMIVEYIIKF
jgi:hypothetical protein